MAHSTLTMTSIKRVLRQLKKGVEDITVTNLRFDSDRAGGAEARLIYDPEIESMVVIKE
jgi:hypothetical protein